MKAQTCCFRSATSPYNSDMFGKETGCFQTSSKGCFIWIVPADQTDFWDAESWGWKAAQLPSPTKAHHTCASSRARTKPCLLRLLLSQQQSCPWPFIVTSTQTHLSCWRREGRGDQSTRGPSSLPAQGQELTDVGPHQAAVTCSAPWVAGKQKSHYQAHAEDF